MTKFVRGGFGPWNLDHKRFRCNSFWFVEVLENGNYCILFVVFLSFISCTTWSDYLMHGRSIFKQLQMSWNHFRNIFTPQKLITFWGELTKSQLPRTLPPLDATYWWWKWKRWFSFATLPLNSDHVGLVTSHRKAWWRLFITSAVRQAQSICCSPGRSPIRSMGDILILNVHHFVYVPLPVRSIIYTLQIDYLGDINCIASMPYLNITSSPRLLPKWNCCWTRAAR